ncbi:hypothetical protein SAMN06295888_1439 [Desulfonatronum zhilinae]|nr:hypothetical protein SAMN06295888_1439 [Desulfonatronum zhilinae]
MGTGYFPSDDALRHVAKVISGKDWAHILVTRPEITMDSHPGWHVILESFHAITGANQLALLNFSVIFLFLTFTLPAVFYFRRNEAWIAALALSSIFFFSPIHRLFYGRPYIASMILILLFCFLWERIRDNDKPWLELGVLALGTALATWIHGTWYLFALPLFALILARQWRVFILASGAVGAGVILGATFTGAPLAFLHQMLFHAVEAFGKHHFQRQLVTEFQPFGGEASVFILVGGLLLWRWARGEWETRTVDNPIFYLIAIGWTMGFIASRFWSDWAWPALAFWTAREIQAALEYYIEEFSLKRLLIAGAFCLVLFLAVTNDRGSRWSGSVSEWPSMTNEDHRPWLPDEGGILYNDNMRLFYEVFYQNPHGPWRYTLGFEPIWMPADNLETYRHIQLTRGKDNSYVPWVDKMSDKDRMVLIRTSKPTIPGLEWHEVTPTIWSGRLSN